MLTILQRICDNIQDGVGCTFSENVCEALGLDWIKTGDTKLADELASQVMFEVNRSYQLCPLDANGEPIHVGDYLDTIGRVQAIGDDMVCAGELINSDEPPYFSGYPHFAPDSYALENPYREVLQEFADYIGAEVTPYALGMFESKLKALQ